MNEIPHFKSWFLLHVQQSPPHIIFGFCLYYNNINIIIFLPHHIFSTFVSEPQSFLRRWCIMHNITLHAPVTVSVMLWVARCIFILIYSIKSFKSCLTKTLDGDCVCLWVLLIGADWVSAPLIFSDSDLVSAYCWHVAAHLLVFPFNVYATDAFTCEHVLHYTLGICVTVQEAPQVKLQVWTDWTCVWWSERCEWFLSSPSGLGGDGSVGGWFWSLH